MGIASGFRSIQSTFAPPASSSLTVRRRSCLLCDASRSEPGIATRFTVCLPRWPHILRRLTGAGVAAETPLAMPWFNKRSDGEPSDDAPTRRGGPRLALFVVEGADPGAELRLAHFDMEIGRGDETRARGDRLLLRDRSVSTRQAKLLPGADGWTLEHLPNASNPTLLNGQSIQRKLLSLADRIALGRVVLEVRVATPLEAKTEIVRRQSAADTTLMMKLGGDAWGHLAVLRGPHSLLGSRLPLS